MLNALRERGISTPKIIGVDGGVIFMEFMQGQILSERTEEDNLNDHDLQLTASSLAEVHAALEDAHVELREHLDEDANVVVNFRKKTIPILDDADFLSLPAAQRAQFESLVRRIEKLLSRNTQYEEDENLIFGDWKDENLIHSSPDRLSILDPWICRGRPSMDLAKFGRGLLFKNFRAFKDHFFPFIIAYQASSKREIPYKEIVSMLAIDLINNLRGYLLIQEELIEQFPDFVRNVRQSADIFLGGIIPTLLDEAMTEVNAIDPPKEIPVSIKRDERFQRRNFPKSINATDIAERIRIPERSECPPLVVIGTVCRGIGTAFLNCFADHYPSYFQPFKTVMRHMLAGGDLEISIPPNGHCMELPVIMKESFGPYFEEESTLDIMEVLSRISYPKDRIHYVGVLRNPSAVFSSWIQHFAHFDLTRFEESFVQTYKQLLQAKQYGIRTTALVCEEFERAGTDFVFQRLSHRLALPTAINGQWSEQGFGRNFIKIQEPDLFRIQGIHEKVKSSGGFSPERSIRPLSVPQIARPFIRRLEEIYELMTKESERDFSGFNETCIESVHDDMTHLEPKA